MFFTFISAVTEADIAASTSCTAYKRYNPNTPVVVHGALKLSIKYGCDTLRARLVENLEADWPQTLAQGDARRL